MVQSKENMKTRIQLDMSPNEVTRLNWVMDACDLNTRKELFNNALTLLEWAAKETAQGRKIASFDDTTHDRRILSMPVLSAAENFNARHPIAATTADPPQAEDDLAADTSSSTGGSVAFG